MDSANNRCPAWLVLPLTVLLLLPALLLAEDLPAGSRSSPVSLKTILGDAADGDARAQFTLGAMYETGRGVPRDDALCARWWRASAEQGLADAQKNMGSLYFSGRGVPLDYAQSMQWFLKAAERGVNSAQGNLGLMYLLGDGIPADRVAAQKWFSIAARRGSDVGRYLSARLGPTLAAAEPATATAAADEWLAREPVVVDQTRDGPADDGGSHVQNTNKARWEIPR